jgi:hypothetical protein
MWGNYGNNVFGRFANKVSNYFGHHNGQIEKPDAMNLDYHLDRTHGRRRSLEEDVFIQNYKRQYISDLEKMKKEMKTDTRSLAVKYMAKSDMDFITMSVKDFEKQYGL